MTLKMTSAQVVETSVIVNNNSSFQNYTNPDDHTQQTTDTPGFKPFTVLTEDCKNATGNDDEFYEVEEVLSRRLSKDTLSYEYKVRFKGYGEEDDMWLPSSFFNRPITFASTSKFGRKRKHTLDPDISEETTPKRKQHKTSSHKNPTTSTRDKMSKRIPKTKRDKGKVFRSSLKDSSQQEQTNSEKKADDRDAKSKEKEV